MSGLLLEQVLHEGLLPDGVCIPQTQEYEDTVELRDAVEEELLELLPPNAAELFDTYKGYVQKLTAMQSETCCIRGLSLGIRLASEACTLDERIRG